MKKAVISIILVSLILLMAPIFIGKMVSTKYADSLNQLSTNPSIHVVESQFSPHWFSAQAITTLRLMGDLAEVYPYDIVLKDDITFGPIIFADQGVHFNLAYTNTSFLVEENAVDEEFVLLLKKHLSLHSKITYNLTHVISWELSEITLEEPENKFVFGAMEGEVAISKNKEVQGDYSWQGLRVIAPDMTFEVKHMEMQFDLDVVKGNLYAGNAISTGDYSLLIPEVSLQDTQGNHIFSAKTLTASVESQLDDNLLSGEMHYQIEAINTHSQTYNEADFTVAFKNLELDALSQLNELLNDPTKTNNPHAPLEQFYAATEAINQLLAHKPEVEINTLKVETPDGQIKADAKVAFHNASFNFLNPMALLNGIEANANGAAPKLFFSRIGIDEAINLYTSQGFLRDEKGMITFNLLLNNGKLTLNDIVLPF